MKTKLIYTIGLIFGLIVFNSCDDQLDIPQQGATAVEDFYETDQDALEAVAAMYNAWRAMLFNDYWVKNLLSDDMHCGGGSRGDNPQFEQLNEMRFNPATTTLGDKFSQYYTLIYLSNLAINKFEESSDVKARVMAEAKVARAWAYFDLVTLWGPVPLVTTELAPSEYQQPNAEVSAIWAQIENDLNEAISSNALPEKSGPFDQSVGSRLTKQAAMSFLGKALVFQGKYSEAAIVLKDVINSGKYELYNGNYEDVLRAVSDYNEESIFEFNSLDDPDNPYVQGTNVFGPMIGYRDDQIDLTAYYWGAHPLHPFLSWGFGSPTADLYEAFVEMEGVGGYRLNNTLKTYPQLMSMFITIKDGGRVYGNEGYFSWKQRFVASEAIAGTNGFAISANYRVMRYAEVLLLAAEACLQSGDDGNALTYINTVRNRAQLTLLGSVTLDDVKREKRLELCYEGVRYQDLLRWGDAVTVFAEKGKEIPVFLGLKEDFSFDVRYEYKNESYGFKEGKHDLLPFPEHEMNVNQNIAQNPNW
jgi:hypothetical protein